MVNVTINICTYHRPELLKKCVRSIGCLPIPENWQIQILIVDNACSQSCKELTEQLSLTSEIKIHYFAESRLGIPFARNRACVESLKVNADWIIFIDDDETASKNWLIAYASALEKNKTNILTGPVKYIFPENHEKWLGNKGFRDIPDGAELKRAATNNVMFSSSILKILSPDQWFDEKMKLIGGSDSEFFTRLVNLGEKIVFVKQAEVIEPVTMSRLSMRWRLGRQFHSSIVRIYVDSKLHGYGKCLPKYGLEALRRIMDGLIGFSVLPVVAILPGKSTKRQLYHSFRHFFKAAGLIVGLGLRKNLNFKRND